MHVATTPGGTYRVCCNSDSKLNQLTQGSTSERLKVNKHSIAELHQSDVMKKIRGELLAGDRPAMCRRCFTQEDASVRSPREIYNDQWYDPDKVYAVDDPVDARYLDLRLGNLCNLKCRMCNPYSSNQWVDDWETINGVFDDTERAWLRNMQWPNFKQAGVHLTEMLLSAEEIYFTGGEPTIIDKHEQLLDYCIDQGIAHKIALKYNTNLTNAPMKLVKKWNQFKSLRLNCSIDAVGKLNDYIRNPSKWKGIWKNFNRVLDSNSEFVIDIHCTVQVTNALSLHKLIERFVRPINAVDDTRVPFVFFNLLEHPDHMNIKALPLELKDQVANSLAPWLGHPDLLQLQGVIDYMYQADWHHLWGEFMEHTSRLDEMRLESLTDAEPGFKGWV
jgi:uncharacterized radical SAM superfamily Fe-S cluster-containing enzyme